MKRAITSLMLLVALLAGMLVQPAGLTAAPRTKRVEIAPGVTYIRHIYPNIPLRVHTVTIDPAALSTLDTVLASNMLPGKERTSHMAARSGAIVAINGDYARSSGRPVHLFASDGDLIQTALSYGRNFAMARDESSAHFGRPKQRVYATELDGLVEHVIGRVNVGPPRYGEIVMYTPESHGLLKLPEDVCAARLYPVRRATMNAEGVPEARYQIDAVRCSKTSLRRNGGTLLLARRSGNRADEFAFPYLYPGDQIDIGWTVDWPNVADSIGGNPLILNDGVIPYDELRGSQPFLGRNPRTGVGVAADGTVILMVVDGRWRRRSIGADLVKLARLFKKFGAVWALNLDGGGSSTMVINGNVVNHPSDGSERYVSSALVLLPGVDKGEAYPEREPEPEPLAAPYASDRAFLTDPASTGGLADLLTSRGSSSPSLTRYARIFERARRLTASRRG